MPECLDYFEPSDVDIWQPAQILAWQWDTRAQRRRRRQSPEGRGGGKGNHRVRAASIIGPGQAEPLWSMKDIARVV